MPFQMDVYSKRTIPYTTSSKTGNSRMILQVKFNRYRQRPSETGKNRAGENKGDKNLSYKAKTNFQATNLRLIIFLLQLLQMRQIIPDHKVQSTLMKMIVWSFLTRHFHYINYFELFVLICSQ